MSPSPARDDAAASSSTVLVGFSGRVSSCMDEKRFCLLCVVQCRHAAYVTTRCRRARFFIAYDDHVYYSICSHMHHKEPENHQKVSWRLNPACSTRCGRSSASSIAVSALKICLWPIIAVRDTLVFCLTPWSVLRYARMRVPDWQARRSVECIGDWHERGVSHEYALDTSAIFNARWRRCGGYPDVRAHRSLLRVRG